METGTWKMGKQKVYRLNSFFKMKLIGDDCLMLHFPKMKQMRFFDFELREKKSIVFS